MKTIEDTNNTVQNVPFWNWTKIASDDRNMNQDASEHEQPSEEYDITELVVVGSCMIIMLLLCVIQRYREDQWTCYCGGCMCVKSAGRSIPNILIDNEAVSEPEQPETSKKYRDRDRDTPPPYEHPPSYSVALQMEGRHVNM